MPKAKKVKPIKKIRPINEGALLSALKKLKARGPWPAPAERMTPDEQIALNEAHEWQIKYEQKKRHARRMAKLDHSEALELSPLYPLAKMHIRR
ncbi:hypothetical protein ES703_17441 [subsurface metagenome]